MARTRSIRLRRNKRKINQVMELQLTSMLDILVIILVFLLKSYTVSTNHFSSVPGIQLPLSISQNPAYDSLHLIITPESMTFEDHRILDFVQTQESLQDLEPVYAFNNEDLDEGGRRVIPLYDALVRARDQAELLRAKSQARDEEGNPLPFDGILSIQVDKRIPYDVLRRVMYTAGTAGYKVFNLLAMRREN